MDKLYIRLRNFLGTLGILLPVLTVLGCLFSPNTKFSGWCSSISITYYSTPVLTMILSAIAFFLIAYRSYEKIDTIVNTLSGFCALGVVMFPSKCDWLLDDVKVGLFYLPLRISSVIHIVFAFSLFILFSINILFLFTKGANKNKNIFYRICGICVLVFTVGVVLDVLFLETAYLTMIFEAALLICFGVPWLIKGHLFDKFLGE